MIDVRVARGRTYALWEPSGPDRPRSLRDSRATSVRRFRGSPRGRRGTELRELHGLTRRAPGPSGAADGRGGRRELPLDPLRGGVCLGRRRGARGRPDRRRGRRRRGVGRRDGAHDKPPNRRGDRGARYRRRRPVRGASGSDVPRRVRADGDRPTSTRTAGAAGIWPTSPRRTTRTRSPTSTLSTARKCPSRRRWTPHLSRPLHLLRRPARSPTARARS